MSELTLTIYSSRGEGARAVPVTGSYLTIGRGDSCSLVVADEGLARLHASIRLEEDGTIWFLDERSDGGGSFINDARVPASGQPLADGDQIFIGAHTIILTSIRRRAPEPARNDARAAPPRGRRDEVRRPLLVPTILFSACLIGIAALGARAWNRRVGGGSQGPPATTPARDDAVNRPAPTPAGNADNTVASGTAAVTPAPDETAAAPAPGVEYLAPSAPRKLYLQMNERERAQYIEQKAQHIARMIGNRQYAFGDDVVRDIKKYLDGYARRSKSSSTGLWGEGLRTLYGRATRYAPTIIRAFDERGVPPVVGLYIVMIETEYHECLQSPVGAKGLFQFMPDTAREFGIDPDDRCNVEIMAPAAAGYMSKRIAEFGTDPMSVALGIAGYNRGPDSVRRDLSNVVNSANRERSFWTLAANMEKLDHFFQKENIKYVPKFFAAAIVGENPWDFGLDIRQLSTYTTAAPSASPTPAAK